MNKFMMAAFVAALFLTDSFAQAAALCPPNSCNVHNGCMEGCTVRSADGVAACNDDDPNSAENEALLKGTYYAHASCAHGYFLTSKWQIEKQATEYSCEVTAHATFSCFQ